MTDLVGAFSLDGAPLGARLPAPVRRQMLAASPASSREREIVDRGRFLGQVWMAAAPGCLVTAPGGCLAMEGFLPPLGTERQSLSRLLAARKPGGQPWTPPPEGHYVLACFDEADRSLCLLRGLSGGERLYYARLGELILFASTVRALLAHPDVGRELNPARSAEAVLTGLTLFGADTLFDNVHEVLAGHALHARAGRLEQVWQWPGLLEPREGGRRRLARDYRDALADSITLAAGDARPVAVSLSGGIDSAAVAALAVEAFGADNVAAFTYEFDDPAHANETPFAVEVCRRLGIRRHDVLPIGLDEFLATIPETVWRAEHFVHWPKAFMLIAARRIREQGCRIVLSGFGIGSHMGFLEDLAWMIEQLPTPGAARVLPWLWRAAKTRRGGGSSGPRQCIQPSPAPICGCTICSPDYSAREVSPRRQAGTTRGRCEGWSRRRSTGGVSRIRVSRMRRSPIS